MEKVKKSAGKINEMLKLMKSLSVWTSTMSVVVSQQLEYKTFRRKERSLYPMKT